LDDLVEKLMDFSEQLQQKREVQVAKNSPSFRMRSISSNHKTAITQMSQYSFARDSLTRWMCSKLFEEEGYVINISDCEIISCAVGCLHCINFCLHRISCSCPDAVGGFSYCKHAHLLCVKLMESENSLDLVSLKAKPQQVEILREK
jgi:hypothetical protein